MQAPTTAAPSASQSAEDLYKARLQYDPQTAELEYKMAQQYSPLYAALYKQTLAEQFPGLNELQQTGTATALDQLKSAYGLAPESSYSQYQRGQLQKQYRERANLGGGLYGGRAQEGENTAVANLEQSFRSQAQQAALPYLQILYPQITQQSAVSQGVTPSANTLYQAMYGASQPESYLQQGQPSPLWGLAGSVGGGIAGGWANNFFK